MDHRVVARPLAGLLAACVALLTVLGGAPAAHAGDGGGGGGDIFRYWAYFHVEDGEYVTAQEGLAGFQPDDGSVEALRYAAPEDFENPNLPRADLSEVDFEAVCGGTDAGSDEKQVAVILDFGVEADSGGSEVPEPRAECATVPQQANALQAVQSVSEVRTEQSSFGPQLCGVEGYPATGCSEAVQSATPPDEGTIDVAIAGESGSGEGSGDQSGEGSAETASGSESGEDSSNTVLYVVIGAVALALLIGGLVLARRRA